MFDSSSSTAELTRATRWERNEPRNGITSLATHCLEVTAKQGVWEKGVEEESRDCSSLSFAPTTSEPLALTNATASLPAGFTGSFYINKLWRAPRVGSLPAVVVATAGPGDAKAKGLQGVPSSQGKELTL